MARSTRMRSTLELGVDNKTTAEIEKIQGGLRGLARSTGDYDKRMAAARGRLVDAAAAGWALYHALEAPVRAGLEYDTMLHDIGQKADFATGELAKLDKQIRKTGLSTARGAADTAKSIDLLIGYGIDEKVSAQAAEPIGKAATAYNASTDDLANATAAMLGNLGITAGEVSYALDIMAAGGKEGAFEIKDMAGEFAGLTAAAAALGMTGTKSVADLVAMLEVARKGAATGAEAANNTANFMQKIVSKEAIKNFSKFGVDIVKELKYAQKNGLSPIEHSLEKISDLTNGGDAALLAQLFSDKQVLQFIRPLIANMEEYRRIRDEATQAQGMVERDFKARLESPGGAISRFQASVENLNLVVGQQLLPELTRLVTQITPMIDGLASFVEANGELTAELITVAAALVGLRVAAAAGGWAGLFLGGPGAMGKGGGKGKGGAFGGGGSKGRAGPSGGGLGYAGIIGGVGAALDMKSFGDAVREDGGKAWLAERDQRDKEINDWLRSLKVGGFAPFAAFEDFNKSVHGGAADLARSAGAMLPKGKGAANEVAELRAEIAALDRQISTMEPSGPGSPDPAARLKNMRTVLLADLKDMEQEAGASGAATASAIADGFDQQAPDVANSLQRLMQYLRVVAASGVKVPVGVTSQVSSARRDLNGARAAGGKVVAGGIYRVNELGEEMFSPSVDGYVHNARDSRKFLSGAAGGASRGTGQNNFYFGDIILPAAQNAEEIARDLGQILREKLAGIHSDTEWSAG